jgi:YVTN family beta-propeller protein
MAAPSTGVNVRLLTFEPHFLPSYMVNRMGGRVQWLVVLLAVAAFSYDYRAPAGNLPAVRRPGAASIIPGGRVISPLGIQHQTGPGPFGLVVSEGGKYVVTADGGPRRYSLTILRRTRDRFEKEHVVAPRDRESAGDDDDWRSVFMGLAIDGDDRIFASEGNSGRVRQAGLPNGNRQRVFDLNTDGFKDSYTGDLAFDQMRGILYVVDQANFRVAAIDVKRRRILSSVRVGRLPFAAALSPDGQRLYVTNIGMFEYSAIPGADPKRAEETGLPFPAFGFPSPEAESGVKRETALGPVDVPGLGKTNVRESNSLCMIDVANPEAPKVISFVPTGLPFGEYTQGGSAPSGVVATADRVYVSNAHNDSVTVIDAGTLKKVVEIPIRIPGLEIYRGILPIGMALDAATGWLLVAEAGINAVGVIDTKKNAVIAHLPAGWMPTRVAVEGGMVYVTNGKGHGTGPNAGRENWRDNTFQGLLRRGTVSVFPMPESDELPKHTGRVFANNGFIVQKTPPPPIPKELKYVVLIVKENRTFDEVFGDMKAVNAPVAGVSVLARFGARGYVLPRRNEARLGLRNINITPNHHAMAQRWAFSDNFYADSEVSVDGHHWLAGSYPDAWTQSSLWAAYGGQKDFRLPTTAPGRLLFAESNSSVHPEEQPEDGTLWHHLDRNGVTFRNFGEGFELAGSDEGPGLEPTGARFLTNVPMLDPLYRNTSRNYPGYNMNIPDQYRATQFINEIEQMYRKPGKDLPRFIFIHLPNDHMAEPRPEDGYPYDASFVADNDLALGRIVEYLSQTPWWNQMAILITEDDAQGGVDHIDSHRTLLLVVSPYARKNYVSKVHSSFPGLLKTVFRILAIPPLNLFDATASDVADCFGETPDFSTYNALPVPSNLFDPERARAPVDPKPSPPMDSPTVLMEQHREGGRP